MTNSAIGQAPGDTDFLAAGLAPNYLGNPEVVSNLIQGFCQRLNALFAARISGTMAAAEFVAAANAMGLEFSRVFSGRDPAYRPIVGYNTATLPYRVRSILGAYWTKHRARFDDDALRVLFEWLLVTQANALKDEDDIAAQMAMIDGLRITRETLLGINQRHGA